MAVQRTSQRIVGETIVAQTSESESGGYEANFIDPVDDLTCIICHLVAREAHQMSCCGKLLCSSCIREWKRCNIINQSQCTHCRKGDAKNFPDFRIQAKIKELRVSCKYEDAGCDWSGKLPDKKSHEKSCNLRPVQCPNGCSQEIIHQNLNHHRENECPKRTHECQICKKSGTYGDMITKHPSICPRMQISCPNSCGQEILRFQFDAHRASCSKEILSCPYSSAGCSLRFLREGLTRHTKESLSHHLDLAMNRISELEQKQLQSPPVTFQIPDYSSRLVGQPWYSPPFYTTANASGYKMCLEVIIKDECLSVKVYLMRGQNDDKLIWPFEGKVKVEMLNQINDKDHHSAGTIDFVEKSPKEFNSRVTAGERSTIGLGHDYFIFHDDLECDDDDDIQYLKNDCIYFRVSQVTVKPPCKPWLVQSLFHAH